MGRELDFIEKLNTPKRKFTSEFMGEFTDEFIGEFPFSSPRHLHYCSIKNQPHSSITKLNPLRKEQFEVLFPICPSGTVNTKSG